MSSSTLPKSIADRLCIALSFAFVGPFIGSVAMLAVLVLIALGNPHGDFSAVAAFVLFIFAMGYMFGFGPALVAGIVYAVLPGAMQRLIIAAPLGAAAVWVFYEVVKATVPNPGISEDMSSNLMMLGAGAVAAAVCAWIARRSGWTPDHRFDPSAA